MWRNAFEIWRSIADLSAESGIHPNDIVSTLQFHHMMRYYKGKHIILSVSVQLFSSQNGRAKTTGKDGDYKSCLEGVRGKREIFLKGTREGRSD